MNLEDRIERRRGIERESQLVREYDAITPTIHVDEPINRGPALERLLDHLEPAFEATLPPAGYVWGPKGSGKSALVSALFAHLSRRSHQSRSVIPTSTRAESSRISEFVYVDARTARTDFALYHAILDTLVEDSVPEHGVSTEQLQMKLHERLSASGTGAVVALDHLCEPETHSVGDVAALLSSISAPTTWLAIGRIPPEEVDQHVAVSIELRPYQRHMLEDVVASRVSRGLTRHTLSYDLIQNVAAWAEGDAHDALSCVFGAVDHAVSVGHDRVRSADVTVGMDGVPRPCVSLGRVLALPTNHKNVLRQLVDLNNEQRRSVNVATDTIADADNVELSHTTVMRILYELSETGIVRRVQNERSDGTERPPSRVESRFPTCVFRRLYDANV